MMGIDLKDTRVDIVVIGSGPGGSLTACLLAEAGRDVLLIEEGPDLAQSSSPLFSSQEMVQKYRNGGITVALGRTNVVYVEGRCNGGGSEINSGLCTRASAEVLDEWRRTHDVRALTAADLEPYYDRNDVELETAIAPITAPAAQKLHEGADRLGWKSWEVPRWVRYGQVSGGGSAMVERRSMTEIFIPRARAAGCHVLSDTRAIRVVRHGGKLEVVLESLSDGVERRQITVQANTVFVACGATQTPALLFRSGIRKNVGNELRLHSMLKVIGQFPEEVTATDPSMPARQINEFSPRLVFGCSVSKPAHLATIMLSNPEYLSSLELYWQHMAAFYTSARGGRGTVRLLPGFRDPLVRYHLDDNDLAELSEGLKRLCEVLFAAGATVVYPGVTGLDALYSERDLDRIPDPLPARDTNLTTVHLMGSSPMGENQSVCVADSFGRVHGGKGLYIADSSLFCGSLGANPQATIMAIARRNAQRFLAEH